MTSYRELATSLQAFGLERSTPMLVHASLAALGPVNGGVDTLLGALLASFDTVIVPVFTRRTLLIPEIGPPDNGIFYGSGRISNLNAEFFRADMPADRSVGELSESLRRLPQASRSTHPALSFAGVNAAAILAVQSLEEPLGPLQALNELGGWVLLLGVDHSANTALHLAEAQSGRKLFLRWALTPYGVLECPNMPGCSQGFNAIAPRIRRITRQVQIGETTAQAVPLTDLLSIARAWLAAEPLALLCEQPDCAQCQAVRQQVVRV